MEQAYDQFRLAGVPAQASNNVGFLYEERGELARAYDYYMIALQEDPELTQARRNLERVCSQLGRPLPALPQPAAPPPTPSFEPPAATPAQSEPTS
jgi:tetratricopeptide (TPR) repeat protein